MIQQAYIRVYDSAIFLWDLSLENGIEYAQGHSSPTQCCVRLCRAKLKETNDDQSVTISTHSARTNASIV